MRRARISRALRRTAPCVAAGALTGVLAFSAGAAVAPSVVPQGGGIWSAPELVPGPGALTPDVVDEAPIAPDGGAWSAPDGLGLSTAAEDAVLLPTGAVLVFGSAGRGTDGAGTATVYEPGTGSVTPVDPRSTRARVIPTTSAVRGTCCCPTERCSSWAVAADRRPTPREIAGSTGSWSSTPMPSPGPTRERWRWGDAFPPRRSSDDGRVVIYGGDPGRAAAA